MFRVVSCAGDGEVARSGNYPLSRWYLRPLAGLLAERLADTCIRPWHVTLVGFALAMTAGVLIVVKSSLLPIAALLTFAWWFCDRTDGQLARRQGTVSSLGAWLDGNLDELVDLGLHIAMAHVAASQGGTYAWPLLVSFIFGKYLLMHGLIEVRQKETSPLPVQRSPASLGRTLYHLPGNADVRTHLTILALATGYLTTELAIIAAYYNLRWLARYPLVIARAGRQAG